MLKTVRAVRHYCPIARISLLSAAAFIWPLPASAQSAVYGANPLAGVALDGAGNLYGTASAGGAANQGVVYKVDSSGNETVLYNFTGGADGGVPFGGVVLDSAQNLYGTTSAGGSHRLGVIYKLDPRGNQTVLHAFTGGEDGSVPYAGLVIDANGNLYGTTYQGGTYKVGVVFQLTPSGTLNVLHSFMGGADGSNPSAGVFRDPAGNLYGTTVYGGSTAEPCSSYPKGCGVVYRLDPVGRETVLHNFRSNADGAEPYGGVVVDRSGNLYGTTYYGGLSQTCYDGCGTIFKISATGGKSTVHVFTGPDGYNPQPNLIADSAGNIYGTADSGGSLGGGVVYKLTSAGVFTVLLNFNDRSPGSADGYEPKAGVTLDSSGNLYGTTEYGGPAGDGAVYRLSPTGRRQSTIVSKMANRCPDSGSKWEKCWHREARNRGRRCGRGPNSSKTLVYFAFSHNH